MKKLSIYIILLIILTFGISNRIYVAKLMRPDIDDLFQLKGLQMAELKDIFKNHTFYGDHSSFPGEYIVNYVPMKIMNLFNKPIYFDLANNGRDMLSLNGGIDKNIMKSILIPHVIFVLLCFIMTYLYIRRNIKSDIGQIVTFLLIAFNGSLIYNDTGFRPYAVLPALAIMNLFFANIFVKSERLEIITIFYPILFIFTSIYHAYGILIAMLCLLYNATIYRVLWLKWLYFLIPSIAIWLFYSSYNNFGFSPGEIQSVVPTFQYIPKANFAASILTLLFSNHTLFAIIAPVALASITKVQGAKKKRYLFFLIMLVLIPLSAIVLTDMKNSYWILPRQFTWVMVYFSIWIGKGFDYLC